MRKAGAWIVHVEELGYDQIVGGVEAKNALGQDLLNAILRDPGTQEIKVTSGNFAGGVRFISPTYAGATFDSNGVFQYFGYYGRWMRRAVRDRNIRSTGHRGCGRFSMVGESTTAVRYIYPRFSSPELSSYDGFDTVLKDIELSSAKHIVAAMWWMEASQRVWASWWILMSSFTTMRRCNYLM